MDQGNDPNNLGSPQNLLPILIPKTDNNTEGTSTKSNIEININVHSSIIESKVLGTVEQNRDQNSNSDPVGTDIHSEILCDDKIYNETNINKICQYPNLDTPISTTNLEFNVTDHTNILPDKEGDNGANLGKAEDNAILPILYPENTLQMVDPADFNNTNNNNSNVNNDNHQEIVNNDDEKVNNNNNKNSHDISVGNHNNNVKYSSTQLEIDNGDFLNNIGKTNIFVSNNDSEDFPLPVELLSTVEIKLEKEDLLLDKEESQVIADNINIEEEIQSIAITGSFKIQFSYIRQYMIQRIDEILEKFKSSDSTYGACEKSIKKIYREVIDKLSVIDSQFGGLQRLCELMIDPFIYYKLAENFILGVKKIIRFTYIDDVSIYDQFSFTDIVIDDVFPYPQYYIIKEFDSSPKIEYEPYDPPDLDEISLDVPSEDPIQLRNSAKQDYIEKTTDLVTVLVDTNNNNNNSHSNETKCIVDPPSLVPSDDLAITMDSKTIADSESNTDKTLKPLPPLGFSTPISFTLDQSVGSSYLRSSGSKSANFRDQTGRNNDGSAVAGIINRITPNPRKYVGYHSGSFRSDQVRTAALNIKRHSQSFLKPNS